MKTCYNFIHLIHSLDSFTQKICNLINMAAYSLLYYLYTVNIYKFHFTYFTFTKKVRLMPQIYTTTFTDFNNHLLQN